MTSAKLENYMFPRPGSPTKEDLRPNAHPYPIKTTSTGVLSRHNSSSSFGASQNGHHYVPSPSPSPSRASPVRKMNGHGHRYSRSLSSDGPRPLPIPPPSPSNSDSSPTRSESPTRTQRSRRADTLPTPPGGTANPRLPALDELPSNPKAWTPSQLSLYLSTTLRVKSGETLQLPAPVAQDIANFVRESKITGRSFLRMKEEDLEQFDINKLWRSALLSASRSLRQSVLKGRIWGFGSIQESPDSPISTLDDDDDDTPHKRRRSMSLSETRSHNPFVNGSASSSVEDLSESSPIRRSNAITGRFRNGRVKGMVESFERSGSVDEGMSDGSISRRERSNSNASNGTSIYDTADGTETDTYANATARPSSTRPLPAPPTESYINSDDELSMDELLHRAGILPTSSHRDTNVSKRRSKRRAGAPIGVHAWESEPQDRVTVKRVMPIPGANLEDVFVLASPSPDPLNSKVEKVDVAVDSEPMMLVTPFDEHRLEQEIEETKMLVKKLRRRIEVVEKKVSHMEARELEREEHERARESQVPPPPPPLFPPGSILARVFSRLFGSKALTSLQKSKLFTSAYYQRLAEPTSLRGIPSYVFLVGLGVCAVVFKVLVRKSATVSFVTRRR